MNGRGGFPEEALITKRLLAQPGWPLTPELDAELRFLAREGLLLPDAEFERRLAAGEPIYPEPGAQI